MRSGFFRIIFMAFLTAFTLHLLLFSYSPLISPLMDEMGISYTQAGAAFSICILALIVLRLPWGLLIDRIGFLKAVKIALLIISIFGILRSFSTNFLMLMVFQFFLGIGFAAILPCLSKLVSVWSKRRAGLATGFYVAGFPVGEVTAVILTVNLMVFFNSWRIPFFVFGVWAFLLFILWVIFGKEPSWSGSSGFVNTKAFFKYNFLELIKLREIWVLSVLCILGMGFYDTLLTWLPKILELRGFQPIIAGSLASALPLGFLVSSISIGVISDKTHSKKILLVILGAVGGLVTPLISISYGMLLPTSIFLVGFCATGIVTLIFIMPIEFSKTKEKVGSAVGLISSIGNIGAFLFPILLGYIVDLTESSFYAMLMLSVVIGTAAILSIGGSSIKLFDKEVSIKGR